MKTGGRWPWPSGPAPVSLAVGAGPA